MSLAPLNLTTPQLFLHSTDVKLRTSTATQKSTCLKKDIREKKRQKTFQHFIWHPQFELGKQRQHFFPSLVFFSYFRRNIFSPIRLLFFLQHTHFLNCLHLSPFSHFWQSVKFFDILRKLPSRFGYLIYISFSFPVLHSLITCSNLITFHAIKTFSTRYSRTSIKIDQIPSGANRLLQILREFLSKQTAICSWGPDDYPVFPHRSTFPIHHHSSRTGIPSTTLLAHDIVPKAINLKTFSSSQLITVGVWFLPGTRYQMCTSKMILKNCGNQLE